MTSLKAITCCVLLMILWFKLKFNKRRLGRRVGTLLSWPAVNVREVVSCHLHSIQSISGS